MSKIPLPNEQFDGLLEHRAAVHHVNRVVKTQSYGKRWKPRPHGKARCPRCHEVICRCGPVDPHRLGR
jgi:hypothetical protein